jgi:hypothetical protein
MNRITALLFKLRLFYVLNMCRQQCTIPDAWKIGLIKSIFKKRGVSD